MQLRRGRLGVGAHLAAGLGIVGVAGYAFVAIIGRVYHGPADAVLVTALIALYLLINIIGPGVFAAVEQETSRSVSAAIVTGMPVRPVAQRAGRLTASVFMAVLVVLLVSWPLVLHRVFDDRVGLLLALVSAVAGSAGVYWVRGVLGGQQRFAAYAVTFYVEGAVRLFPCLALLVVAIRDPTAYGLVFAAGSGVAALVLLPVLRMGSNGTDVQQVVGMGRSLALLVGATALSQTIANLAPVIVAFRLPTDPLAASVFGSTFVLARVPLFVFAPVLAVLLPSLTRAIVTGRQDLFTSRLRRVILTVSVLGAAGVVLGALFGPAAVEILFNAPLRPSSVTLALLTAATVLMMTALVLQPALVALGRQRAVTIGWVLGGAMFLALLALPIGPLTAALTAQLVGPLVVTVYLTIDLRRTLAVAPATPTPGATVV